MSEQQAMASSCMAQEVNTTTKRLQEIIYRQELNLAALGTDHHFGIFQNGGLSPIFLSLFLPNVAVVNARPASPGSVPGDGPGHVDPEFFCFVVLSVGSESVFGFGSPQAFKYMAGHAGCEFVLAQEYLAGCFLAQ